MPRNKSQCAASSCTTKTVSHDLPLCHEHWHSLDQETRTWFVDGDCPFENVTGWDEARLVQLLKRSNL